MSASMSPVTSERPRANGALVLLSLRRQAPVSMPSKLRMETSEMSGFPRERSGKYTRAQLLARLADVINDVARWQPGQLLKERVNAAARALGLSPSRADDLMRREARRTDAEEYLNVLDRYEAWLRYEEKRLANFGRTRRAQLEAWRTTNNETGSQTALAHGADGAACDPLRADAVRGSFLRAGGAD